MQIMQTNIPNLYFFTKSLSDWTNSVAWTEFNSPRNSWQ